MISLEKWMILTPLQKFPNNEGNLGKIIVATGFEWLPKVQKIAQSGHTDSNCCGYFLWKMDYFWLHRAGSRRIWNKNKKWEFDQFS